MWQGKKDTALCFQLDLGFFGESGRGFHSYPQPRAAGKGPCSGEMISWLFPMHPQGYPKCRALRLPRSAHPACVGRAGRAALVSPPHGAGHVLPATQ